MNEIRKQLITCCNETDGALGFDLRKILNGKIVEYEAGGTFPTIVEIILMGRDTNAIISMGGVDYQKDKLPTDQIEKEVKRIHKVKAETLNNICVGNYIAYVEAINLVQDENLTTNRLLNDFEFFYTLLRQVKDNELRDAYRRYWREISFNNAEAIKTNNNIFSVEFTAKARSILAISLRDLYYRLTQYT